MTMPVWAVIYTNTTNPQAITISLSIPAYLNIWWNIPGVSGLGRDGDDMAITFNNLVGTDPLNGWAADWHHNILRDPAAGYDHAYSKSSQDAFAVGYFESYDPACFWVKSNTNCFMTLTSFGNLNAPTANVPIPTWYTVALTNGTGTANGFINAGSRFASGTVPGDGPGVYAADDVADHVMELWTGQAFYPNQFCFPMADLNPYYGNFQQYCAGTILFHARILRDGLNNCAGQYTTHLEVLWTEGQH